MSKVVKVVRAVRNNWKKSVFGACALTYGVNYGVQSYGCKQMMRAYCEAAREIGEAQLPVDNRPRHVTVILNPAANKRKARKEFEEYCAPLLHLAGLSVDVLVTGKEGQARTLMEKLEQVTDAIVVAGGDGTLSEAVTGLLRRPDGLNVVRQIPFGVLPLGKTNTVAKQIFCQSADDHVKHLAEATMAVILEVTKPLDVIKFQVIPTASHEGGKPVFGMVGMHWGAFRDANVRKDKYWYFGGLRKYVTYIFSGLKDESKGVTWQAQAEIEYSPPCEGCSNCFHERIDLQPDGPQKRSWWSAFTKRQPGPVAPIVDYKQRVNQKCGEIKKTQVSTVDFSLLSCNTAGISSTIPQLCMSIGPEKISFEDFVKEGWLRENGKKPALEQNMIFAKDVKIWTVEVSPKSNQGTGSLNGSTESNSKLQERWLSIDNEDYEVKAIHVSLLPNIIKMFHSPRVLIN